MIESLCLFSFGLSLRIKNISKIKQSRLLQWNPDPLRARPLRGSRLLIACVPPHVDVGVDSWSRHSLHHTDHTCNNKRFVDLQLEVYVPSAWLVVCLSTEIGGDPDSIGNDFEILKKWQSINNNDKQTKDRETIKLQKYILYTRLKG